MIRRITALACLLILQFAAAQIEHTVEAGDTLYDIARAYDTTVAEIQTRNALDGSVIRPGQVLVIPVESEPPGYRLHPAAPGDTLATLSGAFGLPEATLVSANPELAGHSDLAGQLVVIPPEAGITLWIEAGQTLIDVAARYGVGPARLAAVNGIDPGTALEIGQPLLVPHEGDPAPAGAAPTRPAAATATAPLAVGGSDGREVHRSLQRSLLGRAWEYAEFIDRPSEAFLYPLQGRLSSYFGWRNISVGGNRFHGGIDLAAPTGTPITASRDGVVNRQGWIGAYGYAVYLDHGDGSQTRYAHLSRIDVQTGQTVRQGDRIGLVGSSGASTGPHLHFEVRFAGRAVDPLLYLEQSLP